MSLKEKLMEDLKASMKNKDKVRKNTVTMIRAAAKQMEVDNRVDPTDDDIIGIIAKQVKQKKDSIDDFKAGNREDLVTLTEEEIAILTEYLPEQLSLEALEEIVVNAIKETNAQSKKDMGKIMGKIMPLIKGKADGKQVNEIVSKYLS
ncbi:MAG: GatB/YqeY domain-containing protein [Clostridiales bacterium 38_11]|nr:MAG: GatB/YqeY domain-containing protein [Clostridiales bacterium 38_11]